MLSNPFRLFNNAKILSSFNPFFLVYLILDFSLPKWMNRPIILCPHVATLNGCPSEGDRQPQCLSKVLGTPIQFQEFPTPVLFP